MHIVVDSSSVLLKKHHEAADLPLSPYIEGHSPYRRPGYIDEVELAKLDDAGADDAAKKRRLVLALYLSIANKVSSQENAYEQSLEGFACFAFETSYAQRQFDELSIFRSFGADTYWPYLCIGFFLGGRGLCTTSTSSSGPRLECARF